MNYVNYMDLFDFSECDTQASIGQTWALQAVARFTHYMVTRCACRAQRPSAATPQQRFMHAK